MSRVAVVGVGAVGGACAGLLCRAGHEVALCVRTPFDALEVEGPGGRERFGAPVFTHPSQVSASPWVLLATKSHQTAAAAPWLEALVAPGTVVAVLQNGVEHVERVTPLARSAQVLPVVVNLPASRRAPGRVVQRRRARLRVPAGAAGEAFVSLFAGSDAEVETSDDFVTDQWRKLCFNAAGGAITCLTGRPLGVIRQPELTELARGLIRECLAVARAEGAALDDDDGEEVLRRLVDGPPDAANSMLQDLWAGRALEWDARNGVVARLGARHGLHTPLSRVVRALLAARDPGDPSRDV